MGFNALDWAIVGAYLAAVLAVGLWAGRRQRDLRDYFLGGRRIPAAAVVFSIFATETSAATFIGTPALAYKGDCSYLLWALGGLLGRLFLAAFFIGVFYRAGVVTVYGWLERRFGPGTRTATAAVFLLARVVASGVRVFVAALAFATVAGIDVRAAIPVIAAAAVLYTLVGGIRAVVWTDVLQGALLVGSALFAIGFLLHRIPGGLETVRAVWRPERTAVFRAGGGVLADAYHPLTALACSFFLTLAAHGTDQDMVQRCLTCRSARSARWSVAVSGLVNVPIVAAFLAVGFLLSVYYGHPAIRAELAASPASERVFPTFIATRMPHGVNALIMAGLFAAAMSSLDSALSALSATAVSDLYAPLRRRARPVGERRLLRASRGATLLFGALLVGVALAAARHEDEGVIELALGSMTLVYGALLGVFLVGIFLPGRGNATSNGIGMGASIAIAAGLAAFPEVPILGQEVGLSWAWRIVAGTAVSAGIAALGRTPRRARPKLPHVGSPVL